MRRLFLEEDYFLKVWIKWSLDFVLPSGQVHNSELDQRIGTLTSMLQHIPPFDPGSVSPKSDVRSRFDLSDPIPEG